MKKRNISFSHAERTKRLPVLWGGQIYSSFGDTADRFQSSIVACKYSWIQKEIEFTSYQTSFSDSKGNETIFSEHFKKVKNLAHFSKLFRLMPLKLFSILCF